MHSYVKGQQETINALEQENFDLVAKCISLIVAYPGWDADDTFIFPDGDRWHRFNPEQDEKFNQAKET